MQKERNNLSTRYKWSSLNGLQKGTYGEYFAKMEFAMHGFSVYTSEVDDHGVDFVAQHGRGGFYEVQVKTVTGNNLVYVNEDKFKKTNRFLVALVRLTEGEPPEFYLFRGSDWDKSTGLLVYNPYEGKKSAPAFEIHLSASREPALVEYAFDRVVRSLIGDA